MLTIRVRRQSEYLFEREYDRSQLVIGRGKDADIVLEHGTVSRRHALLYETQGVKAVTDLGSSNGTYVNGYKLQGPASLRVGDVVYCGIFSIEMLAPMRESSRPAPYPQPPSYDSQQSYRSQQRHGSQPSHDSPPDYSSSQRHGSQPGQEFPTEHSTYDGPPPVAESSAPKPAPQPKKAPPESGPRSEKDDIGRTFAPGEFDLERLRAEMEKRAKERRKGRSTEEPAPSESEPSAPPPNASSPPPPSWASNVGPSSSPIPAPRFDDMQGPSAFHGPGDD